MKSIVLVVALLTHIAAEVNATRGFTYNDDIVCGYPFENFVVESITCATSTFIHVLRDGTEAANVYDNDEVCSFGDQMDIAGRVTVSQAISRNYYVYLKACFRTSDVSWYSAKKCMTFRSSTDLYNSLDVQTEQETNTAIDYSEPGEYTFRSRVQIPKKTFTFKPGMFRYCLLSYFKYTFRD